MKAALVLVAMLCAGCAPTGYVELTDSAGCKLAQNVYIKEDGLHPNGMPFPILNKDGKQICEVRP